jgi:hypothetical protein
MESILSLFNSIRDKTKIKMHEQFYVSWAKNFYNKTELDKYQIASSITGLKLRHNHQPAGGKNRSDSQCEKGVATAFLCKKKLQLLLTPYRGALKF